ncbi:MAG: YdeI/OmpD-associated family protein [Clostridia bacterium]|nr:YdeI/OmpD-associated family protein [Clostridia bacterium]MBR0438612.1 YdeI/OmpD-associated family protein [Clostridia bacterium]
MEIFGTARREEWREYLEKHHKTSEEIWFLFPTAAAEEDSITYNDAVEEALCFGWIDSTNRKLDDLHCIRRFTPRRKGSSYSRPNIERMIWLNERGMLLPEIREAVLPLLEAPFEYPEDIMEALQEDPMVWDKFNSFSEPYKRIRISYIDAARKRPEEFKKRLKSFIDRTGKGKLIKGYGGIEKYYV